jgi:hypothetical protein
MTTKDYHIIADVLNDRSLHLSDSKRTALASRFAARLAVDNPRFDRDQFMTACTKENDNS